MAKDNLKYCRWCRHTMLKGATVCQQCRFGQSVLNKPGLSKIIEIASIVIALSLMLFAWQQANRASNALSQSERLSVEFTKQEQNLAKLGESSATAKADTNQLSSIVIGSMRGMYRNTMAQLATDQKLLELLCPFEITEASLRLDCDIRHVDFSASAVNALEWFTQMPPSVAANADIDKEGAISTICGYQPDSIEAMFNAGGYVMGLENYVPFQNLPEITVENPEDIPTESERRQALDSKVIALYKNESKKWISAGTDAYEKLEELCR